MCSRSKIPHADTDDMASEIAVGEPVLPTKARFCVKCKDYFPVACFMSDNGTDDATLCNRHEPAKNGLRYCRGCDDFVALHLFPKSTKPGFACKKHVSLYGGGRNAKLKQMTDISRAGRMTSACHHCPSACPAKTRYYPTPTLDFCNLDFVSRLAKHATPGTCT